MADGIPSEEFYGQPVSRAVDQGDAALYERKKSLLQLGIRFHRVTVILRKDDDLVLADDFRPAQGFSVCHICFHSQIQASPVPA